MPVRAPKASAHTQDSKAAAPHAGRTPSTAGLDAALAGSLESAQDVFSLSPGQVINLQRTVGNRVVSRLLGSRLPGAGLQAGLAVRDAGDDHEQKADRGALRAQAEQVKSTSASEPTGKAHAAGGAVQRRSDDEEFPADQPEPAAGFEAGAAFERRLDALRGGGSPLPETVRGQMEQGFGVDFGDVRVHAGSEPAQLNREVSAQAFTHGEDIYLGEGARDFGSRDGQKLIAHELTHVVQQTGGITVRRAGGKAGRSPSAARPPVLDVTPAPGLISRGKEKSPKKPPPTSGKKPPPEPKKPKIGPTELNAALLKIRAARDEAAAAELRAQKDETTASGAKLELQTVEEKVTAATKEQKFISDHDSARNYLGQANVAIEQLNAIARRVKVVAGVKAAVEPLAVAAEKALAEAVKQGALVGKGATASESRATKAEAAEQDAISAAGAAASAKAAELAKAEAAMAVKILAKIEELVIEVRNAGDAAHQATVDFRAATLEAGTVTVHVESLEKRVSDADLAAKKQLTAIEDDLSKSKAGLERAKAAAGRAAVAAAAKALVETKQKEAAQAAAEFDAAEQAAAEAKTKAEQAANALEQAKSGVTAAEKAAQEAQSSVATKTQEIEAARQAADRAAQALAQAEATLSNVSAQPAQSPEDAAAALAAAREAVRLATEQKTQAEQQIRAAEQAKADAVTKATADAKAASDAKEQQRLAQELSDARKATAGAQDQTKTKAAAALKAANAALAKAQAAEKKTMQKLAAQKAGLAEQAKQARARSGTPDATSDGLDAFGEALEVAEQRTRILALVKDEAKFEFLRSKIRDLALLEKLLNAFHYDLLKECLDKKLDAAFLQDMVDAAPALLDLNWTATQTATVLVQASALATRGMDKTQLVRLLKIVKAHAFTPANLEKCLGSTGTADWGTLIDYLAAFVGENNLGGIDLQPDKPYLGSVEATYLFPQPVPTESITISAGSKNHFAKGHTFKHYCFELDNINRGTPPGSQPSSMWPSASTGLAEVLAEANAAIQTASAETQARNAIAGTGNRGTFDQQPYANYTLGIEKCGPHAARATQFVPASGAGAIPIGPGTLIAIGRLFGKIT